MQKKESHNPFQSFAIETEGQTVRNIREAIIYTRVSSKEQAENNSLELQLRECRLFAERKNIPVVEYFGGTYESAQTDERKEFGRMMTYAKRRQVSHIIVYSFDRFSRSGDNAIWLTRQLRELGISILSVTQPIDTDNPSGVMMQSIMFLFAQHDNDQRRTKTVAGMQERLRKGEWCTKAPVGYLNTRKGNEKIIVFDELHAPLLRMAFEWKVREKLSDVEIVNRLNAAGWKAGKMTQQRIHEILKNPFYCGIIVSSIIPGEVIEGKHEPLVSKEIFLEVNQIKQNYHHGYKWNKQNEALPLRAFVRCAYCGTGYAGYIVKAKNKYYYKCNKKGCHCNRNADIMHEQFKSLIARFNMHEEYIPLLKKHLMAELESQTQPDLESQERYRRQLTEVQKKLDTLTERFALGEISREIFDKFAPGYKEEIDKIRPLTGNTNLDLSNFEKYVDEYIRLALDIPSLWENSSHHWKVTVQGFLFPDGIHYDHKNGKYRTGRFNGPFASMLEFTGVLEKKRSRRFRFL